MDWPEQTHFLTNRFKDYPLFTRVPHFYYEGQVGGFSEVVVRRGTDATPVIPNSRFKVQDWSHPDDESKTMSPRRRTQNS